MALTSQITAGQGMLCSRSVSSVGYPFMYSYCFVEIRDDGEKLLFICGRWLLNWLLSFISERKLN